MGLQLFPSLYGGEYIYDYISVNPLTFVPMEEGLELTPLRAWAHTVMPSWNWDAGQLDWTARQPGALLRAEFRQSGVASGQQRLCGVRAGHGAD